MPAVNERVTYRSEAGDEWPAVVIGICPGDGSVVAIRIEAPELGVDLELRSVRWYDAPGSAPGAFPKEG